ncbi:hypothetical protein CNMCM5793_005622 [Aspergillus hiratsukae]|uniref:Ankyrin repeat-containing domain protein n=1 Tax=Aspergillus hiratsukae TaxID=1194566 RepID=A0A8H6UZG5_9EURO|nr:hypothetical protein CNMCM5793_005622 [Aspergillus hiratsukae]KAF7171910.1 hypothetical protein CNMCM6106_006252 [Aspergillus hiratsukae]
MALPVLPVEIHFMTLDNLLYTQQPISHQNLCAARNYALSCKRHNSIITGYFRAQRRWRYFYNMLNQFPLWDSPATARRRARMPSGAPGGGPEPDVLTGIICNHCVPCYHLLRDHIVFPVDRFNDFGYSFLGLALTVGCHEIARDIALHIDWPHHITEKANVKNVASESIITLAARTGDERIFQPLFERIPARWRHTVLFNHIRQHERAQLCRTSTPDLANQLFQNGCNIAEGLDNTTLNTSWHYGVRNPCGPLFMSWLADKYAVHLGPDRLNGNYETALMECVRSGTRMGPDVVRWLTNIRVNVQYALQDGTTAAHLAAKLQTDESIEMLEILLPHADPNSGGQQPAGTILHALVDGVQSVEVQLSTNTTLGRAKRREMRRQCYYRVEKKYLDIEKHKIDRTLTNAANLTAVEYASNLRLRHLANYINRTPYNLRSRPLW